jgi:hypothetical protein
VQRLRGVYSSVDIPKGTAISFVPARHIMHRSEFNRSKIWPSLAPLSPVATNHTRTVDLTVGECVFFLLHDYPVFFTHPALPWQLLPTSSTTPAHIGCPICTLPSSPPLPALFSAPPSPSACLAQLQPAARVRRLGPHLGGRKVAGEDGPKSPPFDLVSLLTHLLQAVGDPDLEHSVREFVKCFSL